jgi:LPXTG-site transpeptidase (sortase) family protein
MNQILVTEKVYVTPELKKKKRLYKIEFFISVLLICLLSSFYIYGAYDRDKTEQVSQEILTEVDSTVKTVDNDVMVLVLDENASTDNNEELNDNTNTQTFTSSTGETYTTDATLSIPKIDIEYPVLSETSEELLKVSLNKYWGPSPNEIGNYCIVGHNYRNDKFFGNLNKLTNGDKVYLKDMNGRTIEYQVYNQYIVEPTDTSCTSQLTNGKKELTLITCANYGKQRLVVKCREVK